PTIGVAVGTIQMTAHVLTRQRGIGQILATNTNSMNAVCGSEGRHRGQETESTRNLQVDRQASKYRWPAVEPFKRSVWEALRV
ncbi:MAG: hypothetical protein WAV20_03515, partial [Blastocatellia bacterium]